MTALAPVPSVIKIQEFWKVGSDLTALTGQYFRYTGGSPTATQLNGLCAKAVTSGNEHVRHLHHESVSCLSVKMIDLNSSTGAEGEATGWGAGSRTLSPVPASACFLSVYHIARRYRGGKARNYWPIGVSNDLAGNQLWTGGFVTEAREGLFAWIAHFAGLTEGSIIMQSQVSVSYFEKGTWVDDPVTGRPRYIPKRKEPPEANEVTGWTWSPRIASQRRRLSSGA